MTTTTLSDAKKDLAQAPASKASLENLQNFWYVACLSDSLKRQPLARTVVGQPIVFFRDPQGRAHALVDRCCHRALPLSCGKVTGKGIQCGYHGWEFSPKGQCVRIPGMPPEAEGHVRHTLPSFPVVEQDGLIWVYATPNTASPGKPLPIPYADDSDYLTVEFDFGLVEASTENAIDNFMDSLHTHFIHPGLIYNDKKRNRLEIAVRPYRHPEGHFGVEGVYLGEKAPTQGLLGRIFANTGDVLEHEERYIAPTLQQVDFRIGNTTRLMSTQVVTPETETRLRLYMIIRAKTKLPKVLTRIVLKNIFKRLLGQDIEVLERQQEALKKLGNLSYVSSELDVLSLFSLRFLKQVAEGKPPHVIEVQARRYALDI